MCVAAAIAGGAIVAGGIGAIGATSAANTQAGAAENAQAISQQQFNRINQQEQPFIQSGMGALSLLDYGLGIPSSGYTAPPAFAGGGGAVGGSGLPIGNPMGRLTESVDPTGRTARNTAGTIGPVAPQTTGGPGFGSLITPFTTQNWQQLSPAYNFQRQQGIQGVLNTDASSQGSLSGAAAKDLIGYNQNLANTSFNNAFNMYQTQQGNIFSRLSGIANLGQSAASQTAQSGTALAGQAAQSAQNIGTAQAGGIVGASNAAGGALSSAMPWLYQAQQNNPGQWTDQNLTDWANA